MMMRGYKCGLLLLVLSCWVPVAVADPAASGVAAPAPESIYNIYKAAPSVATDPAASGVAASTVPEEDYQAALKADRANEMVDAARLYRRAAEHGHAAAQVRLAEMLWQGSAKKAAMEYFRKAAEQGNAEGQLGLAMMYMADQVDGEWEMKRDFVETRKWLALAADQGNQQAIITLADAYINGKMDLDENARNSPEALAWIKRAAGVDDFSATKALASAYRSGKYGLAVDPKQADELDDKAKKMSGVVEPKKKSSKTR